MGDKDADSDAKANEFNQTLFQSAMKVTKHSNELPGCGGDWEYYQSFPAFAGAMKHFSDRLTSLMTTVYGHYGLTAKVGRLDFEEQLELVSDNNDVLMERINNSLDEAAGLKKQAETVVVEMMAKTTNINGSWNRLSTGSSPSTPFRLLTAKNILRPQLKFKEKINNKPGPFVPKIKEKPHSMKPLAILLELDDFGEEEYSHPYEFELERFTPDPTFFTINNDIPNFKAIDETPLIMVDNEDGLKKMLIDISTQSVIAVDLEHHSYRTFQGITCLMQITTANADYIVDTLELWDQLQPLNEVFCNPKIVKIFHGADSDVEWLQRDLGLYIVNLFDTYHAAKLLNFAQLSLAFLLRHYCQININKQYQLADWRMRPIPQEMINYAREDTHYLIYVYEKMKQDLKNKGTGDNLLSAVWQNSRLICLKRYKIARVTPESHLELYRQSKRVFNDRQLYALRQLFVWRDRIAREEDESTGFVLPKHMMLQIADILPKEMQGILACCSPIPPLVRQHLLHLHEIILRAREMPLSTLQNHGQPLQKAIPAPLEQDPEDPLHCIHDLTHSDIRDDLPTLLASKTSSKAMQVTIKHQPEAGIFIEPAQKGVGSTISISFTSPYSRYVRARAQISAEEAAEAKRIENLRAHFMETVVAETPAEANKKRVNSSDDKAVPLKKKKLPLATQVAKKLKKKKNVAQPEASVEREASNPEPSTSKTRKEAAVEFKPFDYSQVDFKDFQKGPQRKEERRGRGRGRGSGGGGRGHKLHRKGNERSMTYSNK